MSVEEIEATELAQNITRTRELLRFLAGMGCGTERAVTALLSAATVLIEHTTAPPARLTTLNEYLAPTIIEWAEAGGAAPPPGSAVN